MRARATRYDERFKFQRAWWDSDYMPAVVLSIWGGVMWSLIALFASITWDLDQTWYDNSSTMLLPAKVALLWPVWSTVQCEDILASLGWHVGGGFILVLFLSATLPALMAATLCVRLSARRRA